jgi:hypothetical protein
MMGRFIVFSVGIRVGPRNHDLIPICIRWGGKHDGRRGACDGKKTIKIEHENGYKIWHQKGYKIARKKDYKIARKKGYKILQKKGYEIEHKKSL